MFPLRLPTLHSNANNSRSRASHVTIEIIRGRYLTNFHPWLWLFNYNIFFRYKTSISHDFMKSFQQDVGFYILLFIKKKWNNPKLYLRLWQPVWTIVLLEAIIASESKFIGDKCCKWMSRFARLETREVE